MNLEIEPAGPSAGPSVTTARISKYLLSKLRSQIERDELTVPPLVFPFPIGSAQHKRFAKLIRLLILWLSCESSDPVDCARRRRIADDIRNRLPRIRPIPITPRFFSARTLRRESWALAVTPQRIAGLPDKQMIVLLAYCWGELSHTAIAEKAGMAYPKSRKLLQKAKQNLRKMAIRQKPRPRLV